MLAQCGAQRITQQSPIKTTHSKLRRSIMETAVCRTSYRLLSKLSRVNHEIHGVARAHGHPPYLLVELSGNAPGLTTRIFGNIFPNMVNAIKQTLSGAVHRVLYPLVRILIRHGVAFDDFAEIAKRAYVEVGMKELGIEGRIPSVSRVAIISGLTRKEVQRIANRDAETTSEGEMRYNRAARVVAAWVRDPQFSDVSGKPRILPLNGNTDPGFAELVKQHSGDVPTRAMLDELLRVGAVERTVDGHIRLLGRAYIPRASEVDKLTILGHDVSDLINTIDHNLLGGNAEPYFQRKVMYDNLSVEAVERFRRLSRKQAQSLIEKWDRWLAEHDRDANPEVSGEGRVRAGLGIYYFEERLQ